MQGGVQSNCIPSTTSREVSIDLASSTVITPSLPTFSIASAISSPITVSPLALMVPTWAISALPLVALESLESAAFTATTPFSMPRLSSMGDAPAATIRIPSL